MIRGQVNSARQPVISLQIMGAEGRSEAVEAIVDTGFDGSLTLPPDLVTRLDLPFGMTRPYVMGDGRTVEIDVHRTRILWDGREHDVDAVVTTGGVLVGMSLLRGYRLLVDADEGGEVLIQPRR